MSYERDGEWYSSYGEYLRSKNVRVAYCQSVKGLDFTSQKKWDSDLTAYSDARAQGVQPASTRRHSTDNALRISEKTGTAYQAS